jgi:polysaccharide biosynthesis/export protein
LSRFNFIVAGGLLILALGLTSVVGKAESGKLPEQAQSAGQATPTAASGAKSDGPADKGKKTATSVPVADLPPSAYDPSVYRIGVEDELQISVWHEAELSMPVQVRPDGMITLPLINDVPVVGMTTKELQTALTEKLSAFVNEPQVTVIVKGIKSRKVFLVGQVPKPGPYMLVGKKTVLQLILEAGGLSPFAKSGSIFIVRKVNGKETRLKFNYKKAVSGKDEGEDVELFPGDMIVVP